MNCQIVFPKQPDLKVNYKGVEIDKYSLIKLVQEIGLEREIIIHYMLATGIRELDYHVIEAELRDGVTFHHLNDNPFIPAPK